MREYLPLLIVGAIIGTFTLIFVVAYSMVKNKKEAMGFDRNMGDSEIIRRLLTYARPYWKQFVLTLVVNYYVQMAQAWLIAELAVHQPEAVCAWIGRNDLKYNINGKAIQKICDSFRISAEWKQKFKALRPELRLRK